MTHLGRVSSAVVALALVPGRAIAQEDDAERPPRRSSGKSVRKPVAEDGAPRKRRAAYQPDEEREQEPELRLPFDLPDIEMTQSRYAFIGAGVLLLGGLAFGYSAAGEAKRADTVSSAAEARRTLDGARHSATTANIFFGLAAVTLGYALLMEVLPEQKPETRSLTFHF